MRGALPATPAAKPAWRVAVLKSRPQGARATGEEQMNRIALRIEGLSKTFGATRALDSVSLTVGRGEVHALLGENGSGKSTLIKVLAGYHVPDAGVTIEVGEAHLPVGEPRAAHDAGLRFVHQNLGLVESCSIADNLCYNAGYPTRIGTISERRLRSRAAAALRLVGLDLDPATLIAELSPAERTGVAVARAVSEDIEGGTIQLLVLDEPTATLPDNEVERLLSIVRSVAAGGTGVLYVTHRLDEVFEVAVNATVLRDGQVVARTPVAGLTRAQLLHHLVGNEYHPTDLTATSASDHAQPVLIVRNLSTRQIRDVSLSVGPGEVVGVAGITGSGREELCGAIFGAIPRSAGDVLFDGGTMRPERPDLSIIAGAAYIPANRQRDGGFMQLSARENIAASDIRRHWRAPFLRSRSEKAEALEWMEHLNVRPRGATEQLFQAFSGGNQQKILFGKWLRRKPRLFLLDEPTQGVDVPTKAFLHDQLVAAASEGGAVLVSSSDVDELVDLCQRVIVLRDGRIAASLVGEEIAASRISHESLGQQERELTS